MGLKIFSFLKKIKIIFSRNAKIREKKSKIANNIQNLIEKYFHIEFQINIDDWEKEDLEWLLNMSKEACKLLSEIEGYYEISENINLTNFYLQKFRFTNKFSELIKNLKNNNDRFDILQKLNILIEHKSNDINEYSSYLMRQKRSKADEIRIYEMLKNYVERHADRYPETNKNKYNQQQSKELITSMLKEDMHHLDDLIFNLAYSKETNITFKNELDYIKDNFRDILKNLDNDGNDALDNFQ